MVDRIIIQEKLLELEKLQPELFEEAMDFIEYLIHYEKEKQKGIYYMNLICVWLLNLKNFIRNLNYNKQSIII